MYKIVYVSDFNMGGSDSAEKAVPRSGYINIGIELCRKLVEFGHEVKVLGLGYTGQEHNEPFSIIPCSSLQDIVGYANNLKFVWGAQVVIVALDIHQFQESIFPTIRNKLDMKYICITPLESDPLCLTWANLLKDMDKVYFISQFGADEAQKVGVEAEHIEVGINTDAWRLRTKEEYDGIRKTMGFDEDDFVVMTVADNQERKALGRGFQIVSGLKKHGVKAKHILVTREHSIVGWKLYDLAYLDDIRLSSDLRVFNNGIPFADLYTLYCAADAYLCCSKGEGLGIPIMESMSIGIPVVANRTGAIPELLADGRGWIVDWSHWYYDPFGNQRRYDIDIDKAVEALLEVRSKRGVAERTEKARKFMESRDWSTSARQVEDALRGMLE